MKFTKLNSKTDKIINKKINGGSVNVEKLDKLLQQLHTKKSRYEYRLTMDVTTEQRIDLETKLKVVQAQIRKYKLMSST